MRERPGLLIFPCNGNGVEAIDCLGEDFEFLGFVDDTMEKQGFSALGYPVFDRQAFADHPGARILAVPGSPSSYPARLELIASLGLAESRFAQVIHAKATVSRHAVLGRNILIMAGVVITSNAVIGDHVCILPNTVIHHDVVVGEGVLIGSNVTIAGNTVLEDNCYIGSGSSIRHGIRIGAGALVGMGSNVIREVAGGARVVGNPAHDLKERA